MKNILSFVALLATMIAFTACSDKETAGTDTDNTTHTDSVADYTVIFWGMTGGNEAQSLYDLASIVNMKEEDIIGDNVHFYGLIKTASENNAQELLSKYGYDGTQLIDLGKKTGSKVSTSLGTNEEIDAANCAEVFKALNARKYGDAKYPLNNPDSLQKFIKTAAAKYPAKNYILLLFGHGAGFRPAEETANADGYATRGCVYDKEIGKHTCLTADNIVSAVNGSGVKIPLIFFQCCLMANLENIAAYQHCTDYIVASDEVTSSGYMQRFIAYLSQGGASTDSLKSAAKKTVYDYAEHWNEKFTSPDSEFKGLTSHGFYELSYTPALLNSVKSISAWFSNAYDKDSAYIKTIVTTSLLCSNVKGSKSNEEIYYKKIQSVHKFIWGTHTTEPIEKEISEFKNDITELAKVENAYGIVFAAMVKNALDRQSEATSKELDFNALKTYYEQYMSTLRSMSYIHAVGEDTKNPDYCLLYTSPTIDVFAMNKEHFIEPRAVSFLKKEEGTEKFEEDMNKLVKAIENGDKKTRSVILNYYFNGTLFTDKDIETVKTNYTSSQFDKTTQWSKFLEKLTLNPNHITNPERFSYLNYEDFNNK